MAAGSEASSPCATNLASAHRSTAAAARAERQIGDDDVLENFGFRSRPRDRGPDSTGSDDENAHAFTLRAPTQRRALDLRKWKSITTLTIAAQKHHNEMNPLTVNHISTGTATRLSKPSAAMSR